MRCSISCLLLFTVKIINTSGKIESEEESRETDFEYSEEHIGASVTQVNKHPYAASLLNNGTYVCSATILNTYWLLTLSKCYDSNVITSYVTHKNLDPYSIRSGSSYNNKGGSISQIKMLINNFDLKVSATKLSNPLTFNSQISPVNLPIGDVDISLGHLAKAIAWTPTGHMRIVNVPTIDPYICESETKLLPGHYICVGGVQDPNRHFCRQDQGGAVVQNYTLIAISSFMHTCALYTRTHAFPKVPSLARWLDTTIWDENNRPTTKEVPTTVKITQTTTDVETERTAFMDPKKFMLTLPFDPINVPLEPAEDNSVIPRMSMYESYLQSVVKSKTSTTTDTNTDEKSDLYEKLKKSLYMMPPHMIPIKAEPYDYND